MTPTIGPSGVGARPRRAGEPETDGAAAGGAPSAVVASDEDDAGSTPLSGDRLHDAITARHMAAIQAMRTAGPVLLGTGRGATTRRRPDEVERARCVHRRRGSSSRRHEPSLR